MEIILLNGTEKRLYELVAPLVMNPAIIRQNNGYPFKTSKDFIWYIASDNGVIEGFMPLKKTQGGMLIDNYYIRGDNEQTIHCLLEKITDEVGKDSGLKATVFKRHVDIFREHGFRSSIEWKKYDKMTYYDMKKVEDGKATERI